MLVSLSALDFGRCHRCKRPYPLRLLDPVVIDDRENLVYRVSDELYGRCCHDRVVQIMSPGSVSPFDAWLPAVGKRTMTRPEIAFTRAKGASIKEQF